MGSVPETIQIPDVLEHKNFVTVDLTKLPYKLKVTKHSMKNFAWK